MAKLKLEDARRVARIHEAINPAADDPAAEPLTGSRGGKTTVTNGGLLRKTAYFEPSEWEAIRRRAEQDLCTAAEIIRRSVASYLDL